MTDISVGSVAYQVERRSWLLGNHGTGPGDNPSITLDVSAFSAAQHYPNGYIPSGIVLARLIASPNKYVPYLESSATDGTAVAAGILFGSVKIPDLLDLTKDTGGALFVHGFVDVSKLPLTSAATLGGFIDAGARTDLKLIHFTN